MPDDPQPGATVRAPASRATTTLLPLGYTMKLIALILGLILGFGAGIWYGVNRPKEAADLAVKQDEWIRKGKEEALKQVKAKLDGMLTQQPSGPSAPGFARSFSGTGGGQGQTEALKELKGDVEAQLTQVTSQK